MPELPEVETVRAAMAAHPHGPRRDRRLDQRPAPARAPVRSPGALPGRRALHRRPAAGQVPAAGPLLRAHAPRPPRHVGEPGLPRRRAAPPRPRRPHPRRGASPRLRRPEALRTLPGPHPPAAAAQPLAPPSRRGAPLRRLRRRVPARRGQGTQPADQESAPRRPGRGRPRQHLRLRGPLRGAHPPHHAGRPHRPPPRRTPRGGDQDGPAEGRGEGGHHDQRLPGFGGRGALPAGAGRVRARRRGVRGLRPAAAQPRHRRPLPPSTAPAARRRNAAPPGRGAASWGRLLQPCPLGDGRELLETTSSIRPYSPASSGDM